MLGDQIGCLVEGWRVRGHDSEIFDLYYMPHDPARLVILD